MKKFLYALIVLMLVGAVGITAFAAVPINAQPQTSVSSEQNCVSQACEDSDLPCVQENGEGCSESGAPCTESASCVEQSCTENGSACAESASCVEQPCTENGSACAESASCVEQPCTENGSACAESAPCVEQSCTENGSACVPESCEEHCGQKDTGLDTCVKEQTNCGAHHGGHHGGHHCR